MDAPDHVTLTSYARAHPVFGRAAEIPADDTRIIRYVFSDPTVARDGHTIAADAWRLDNFRKNPVFLWAHDSSQPPIGRVVEIGRAGDRLVGAVEYARAEDYPFADTIFRLTKGGFLNATSVGWLPLDWKRANDPERPGGLDFTDVELLEVSKVPVPAAPGALVTAREQGIDTRELHRWAERILDLTGSAGTVRLPAISVIELDRIRKETCMPSPASRAAAKWSCAAARDLPIDHHATWDGGAAEKAIFDHATDGDGKIDPDRAKQAFLLFDSANGDKREGYKEPFATVRDGKMTAVAAGVRAAASRLPDVEDVPDAAKAEARAVIDHYEGQMTTTDDDQRAAPRRIATIAHARGLEHVAHHAWLMDAFEDLYRRVAAEDDREAGEPSDIPDRMRAWLDDGHRLLADHAKQETDEEIAGTALERAMIRALEAVGIRSGKALSAENERCLREALGHHAEVARCVRKVLKAAKRKPDDQEDDPAETDPNAEDGDPDDPERAARKLRERRARARRLAANGSMFGMGADGAF